MIVWVKCHMEGHEVMFCGDVGERVDYFPIGFSGHVVHLEFASESHSKSSFDKFYLFTRIRTGAVMFGCMLCASPNLARRGNEAVL